jgi:dTDP-glucose 4,6-dehydratase
LKPLKAGVYEDLIKFVTDRPGHDSRYAINSKKIIDLGWLPNISWEKGIESTVNWYLKNEGFLTNNSSDNYSGERLGKL